MWLWAGEDSGWGVKVEQTPSPLRLQPSSQLPHSCVLLIPFSTVFHSLPLLFFFLCSSSVCKHPAVALGYERSQWWQQSSTDFKTPSGLRTDGSTIIMFMLVLGGWDLGGSISSLHKYCDWYALGKLDKHDCHDNQRHNKVITSPCCSFKCHILS